MNHENCNELDNECNTGWWGMSSLCCDDEYYECNTGWWGVPCIDIFMWQDINDECEVELSCQCYEANCKLIVG